MLLPQCSGRRSTKYPSEPSFLTPPKHASNITVIASFVPDLGFGRTFKSGWGGHALEENYQIEVLLQFGQELAVTKALYRGPYRILEWLWTLAQLGRLRQTRSLSSSGSGTSGSAPEVFNIGASIITYIILGFLIITIDKWGPTTLF